MTAAGSLRAGSAYVELFAKDGKLRQGLQRVQSLMRNFGTTMKSIGARMLGLGAAIRAPFAVAEGVFTSMGTEMLRMSQRTGVSVESLSQLSYAAKQSGVDAEEVGAGFKYMQKRLGEAEQGIGAAIQSFAKLRVSVAQLRGMAPDQQFELISDRISKLKDPAERAAIAVEIFGRSGTRLLPMMSAGAAGIEKLRKEADELGLTMSTRDATAAEGFSKKMGTLGDVLKMAAFNVGSALVPQLVGLLNTVTKYAAKAAIWIKQNSGLIVSVAKIGSVIAAAGAALYALGTVFSLTAGAVGILSAAIGILSMPFVAIPVIIGGAVAAFLRFTAAGQKLWGQVKAFFAPIGQIFETTFGGIKDAIEGGRLDLAAKIVFLGVRAAMLDGISALADSVGGDLGDFIGTLGTELMSGDLAGVWNTVVKGMANIWQSFSKLVVGVFTSAVRQVLHLWTSMLNSMSGYVVHSAATGGWLAKMLPGSGNDPDLATTYRRRKSEADKKYLEDLNKFQAENREREKQGLEPLEMSDSLALRKSQHEGHTDADAFEAKYLKGVEKANAGTTKGISGFMDDLDNAAAENAALAQNAFGQQIGTGGKGRGIADDDYAKALDELNKARKEAAAAAKPHGSLPDLVRQGRDGQDAALAAGKQSVAGTFNALTAGRQLGGANPVVAKIDKTNMLLEKLRKDVKDGGAFF